MLRSSANDVGIQTAQDATAALNNNASPQGLVAGHVDLQKSLAPFIIIYDKLGEAVAGNGYIGNEIPTIPFGVLNASKNTAYHAVTWQPQSAIRLASVSVKANDFYVVAGKSLKQVESHENQALLLVFIGWILCCSVTVTVYWYLKRRRVHI